MTVWRFAVRVIQQKKKTYGNTAGFSEAASRFPQGGGVIWAVHEPSPYDEKAHIHSLFCRQSLKLAIILLNK